MASVMGAAAEDASAGGAGAKAVVFAWAGFAQWTRSQLLGEMARGSWGWGRLLPSDVASPETQALWGTLRYSDRLAWAPDNELARDFARSMARAMPPTADGADPQAEAVVAALAQQLEALHRGGPRPPPRGSGQSPGGAQPRGRAAAGRAFSGRALPTATAPGQQQPAPETTSEAEAAGRTSPDRPSNNPSRRRRISGSSVPSVQSCVIQ